MSHINELTSDAPICSMTLWLSVARPPSVLKNLLVFDLSARQLWTRGGARRELFRLFLEEMKTRATRLFQRSPAGVLPNHNVTAMNDYFITGCILSASIVLGGPPPMCFTPAVADMLVYGDVQRTPSVESISDPSITDRLNKVSKF